MPAAAAAQPALPIAAHNDNRRPAGTLRDGTLLLRLEAVMARWLPEGPAGPARDVQVFAEDGRAAEVPGPLIRVPAGTDLRVSVRNRLATPLKLRGMMEHPGDAAAIVDIPAGEIRELRFEAGTPGTYFYWATTTSESYVLRRMIDSQLSGAFVVDPERPADRLPDRIFVISEWLDQSVRPAKFTAAINGASWPHAERLTLPFGEAVHWRVVNASFGVHPMHLHGTFYTVESRGDAGRDAIYDAENRRLVTTEMMEPGTTMAMRWVPDRVGNWLFHCHVLAHVTGDMRRGDMTPAQREEAAHHDEHDIEKAMAGLVIGITVTSGDETAAPDLEPHVRRRLTLRMTQEPARYGSGPSLGFAILTDDGTPVPNTAPRLVVPGEAGGVPNPSPTLVLTRGEPVSLTLVSELPRDTQIHWHGIELESYHDGVPGWSGHLRQITPAIKPGDQYEVQFTPPRAGTFIYHTHAHDREQLASGLYGALIVVEPGQTLDPATERIILIGGAGPQSAAIEVNRSTNPAAMDLKVGVTYRFRLINITPNLTVFTSLRGDWGVVKWKPVSKDGADLPPSQMEARRARQTISVGETYDFEFRPEAPGELRLEVQRRSIDAMLTSMVIRVSK
ncbi:MAG TPA: multicopper oxidase domain-containing protein [Vicinamibacterales bacterium]|nr:multicopper oxidase domain-containing protein [Vicinamibacterales bacterium]